MALSYTLKQENCLKGAMYAWPKEVQESRYRLRPGKIPRITRICFFKKINEKREEEMACYLPHSVIPYLIWPYPSHFVRTHLWKLRYLLLIVPFCPLPATLAMSTLSSPTHDDNFYAPLFSSLRKGFTSLYFFLGQNGLSCSQMSALASTMYINLHHALRGASKYHLSQ
jgi:hypothetical protein